MAKRDANGDGVEIPPTEILVAASEANGLAAEVTTVSRDLFNSTCVLGRDSADDTDVADAKGVGGPATVPSVTSVVPDVSAVGQLIVARVVTGGRGVFADDATDEATGGDADEKFVIAVSLALTTTAWEEISKVGLASREVLVLGCAGAGGEVLSSPPPPMLFEGRITPDTRLSIAMFANRSARAFRCLAMCCQAQVISPCLTTAVACDIW